MLSLEQIEIVREWLGSSSIIIFGRPFAGKDFQGRRLADIFDGNIVSSGEVLRNSTLTERAEKAISTGQLVPTEDFVSIVLPYLSQPYLANKPLILSSFGRWHGEEEGVVSAVKESGHPLKAVIYLDISNNESHDRWLARNVNNDRSNRYDDTEEILSIRFKGFEEKTMPVIQYYENLGILINIDGKGTRDEVTHSILDELFRRSTV